MNKAKNEAKLIKGNLYFEQGYKAFEKCNFEGAATFFRQAINDYESCDEISDNVVASYVQLSACLIEMAKYEDAISTLTDAKSNGISSNEIDLNLSIAHYNLGISQIEHDLKSASENFNQAITYNPENFDAAYNIGIINFKSEKFEDAEAFFRRIIDYYKSCNAAPDNLVNYYVQLSACLIEMAKYEDAIEVLKDAKSNSISSNELDLNLSIAHYNLGISQIEYDRASASKNFIEALIYNPENFDAAYKLGIMDFENKKFEDAETFFRRIIDNYESCDEISDNVVASYVQLSACLIEMAKYEDAIEVLKDAKSNGLSSDEINLNLSIAHYNLGISQIEHDRASASKNFIEASIYNPKNFDAIYNIGIMNFEDKKYEQAIANFQNVIDQELFSDIKLNSFWHLIQCKHELGKDIKDVLDATITSLNNVSFIDNIKDSNELDEGKKDKIQIASFIWGAYIVENLKSILSDTTNASDQEESSILKLKNPIKESPIYGLLTKFSKLDQSIGEIIGKTFNHIASGLIERGEKNDSTISEAILSLVECGFNCNLIGSCREEDAD